VPDVLSFLDFAGEVKPVVGALPGEMSERAPAMGRHGAGESLESGDAEGVDREQTKDRPPCIRAPDRRVTGEALEELG